MALLEKPPEYVERELENDPVFQARTDLSGSGSIQEHWLIVTDDEAAVYDDAGGLQSRIAIADMKEARAVQGIGGGALIVDTKQGPIVLMRYTSSLTAVFGFAAKLLSAMAKGEERPVLSEKEVPRLCQSCGMPMQEGTDTCPVCRSNKKILVRMLRYTKEY